MAVGKALNKGFHGSQETGKVPDIAMPNYNETPMIQNAAPDPWQAQQQSQQPHNPLIQVPDELPSDVRQEMDAADNNYAQPNESEAQPVQEYPRQPSAQESFKEIRDAKAKAERERDAILSQMLEMQSRMQQDQQRSIQKVHEEPEQDYQIDDDSLVEGKVVKQVNKKLKNLEKQLEAYQNQSHVATVESKIRSSYPDFDKVVSKENVEILNERFPEIARTLRDTQDLYDKASSAYTVIKQFGIGRDTRYDEDKVKAVANAQKPRPLASVSPTQGDSPLSRANAFANGMTEDLKEQLRKEMYAARKAM